ncbi:DNA translocase FtsK [Marivivens aquimaris]|uniref:DNA translocase FtsK n=1 Tax=Marivivens aquimaris TaxID=2774876 RepID=UPI001881C341|nr:DNA translocase FtsK [Marivivens aquimaris]
MALYSTRQRDPLLDSTTQAALEKRSKELFGIGLVILGTLAAMMLWSYSPDDPNWMLATDAPVQNWLGRTGASIAAPLIMVIGKAAWWIPVLLFAWGVRMGLHQGGERAMTRLVYFPLPIVVGTIWAATLTPGDEWSHAFGLGGMLGNTALGVILSVIPSSDVVALAGVGIVSGIVMLVLGLFVAGFTRPELAMIRRNVFIGLVMGYSLLLRIAGRGAEASVRAAQSGYANVQSRREMRVQRPGAHMEVFEDDDPYDVPMAAPRASRTASVVRPVAAPTYQMPAAEPEYHQTFTQPEQPSLFGKLMPGKLRRNQAKIEPELIENEPPLAAFTEEPSDDRVRARIADAIRARKAPVEQAPLPPITRSAEGDVRIEPTLTAGRGPRALVVEPPMSRAQQPAAPVVAAPMPTISATRSAEPAPFEEPLSTVDFTSGWDEVPPIDETDADNIFTEVPLDMEPEGYQQSYEAEPAVEETHVEPRRVVPAKTMKRSVLPSKPAKPEPASSLHADYETPPVDLLLDPAQIERHHLADEELEDNARMLESVLEDYGIKGEIVSVRPGPVVTMYELEPAPGLKASRVIGLADDIARSMSALSARVSTVPGRSVIGIELPNDKREKVVLREILNSRDYSDPNCRLPLALGKDIGGESIVANLAKMPHLLIAGTTGSGKSVAINTMILSLLYRLTPEECRLIMIDPKMLELSVYDGIPHLLSPVVTDPKKAVVALKWVVGEMEERYRKMSKMGVRNIEGYNGRVRDALGRGEMFERTVQTGFDEETGDPIFETEELTPEAMPYIVVIVDEMADLMMVAGKEIEACIQRLAQMARASGIHLIMATQRPSVDVITGTIKANFPTRISFQVTSKIDSRTILGEQGAEQLLGMGDMLYMAGGGRVTRIHGPFVSDEEVEEIVNYLKAFGPPEYMSGVVDGPDDDRANDIDAVLGLGASGGNTDTEDALYDTAVAIVIKDRKCSTSYIQRKLAIGYNKAARLVEQMEDEGVVSAANHVGKREILVPEQH